MEYSTFVPQLILLFAMAHTIIKALNKYVSHNSLKNKTEVINTIIGFTGLIMLLVWGGFFSR